MQQADVVNAGSERGDVARSSSDRRNRFPTLMLLMATGTVMPGGLRWGFGGL